MPTEEDIIKDAMLEIKKLNSKIRDLNNEIKENKQLIKEQYRIIKNTCTHNWIRQREPIQYGELYTTCTKCGLHYY